MWTFEAIRNPTPTPEKPFRASFPQKTAGDAKATVWRYTNFVQTSKNDSQNNPPFFMISTFEQNHRKRVPITFSVSSFVSAGPAQKTLIEKSRFLENQLALILRIFRTDKGTQFACN